MNSKVLALDLERTLIDDARSARPRPGLFDFLAFCHERFARVVLFTSVETADARDVFQGLVGSGQIPSEFFAALEYVEWSGAYKDFGFVPDTEPSEVLLVDDDAGWVRPDQRMGWISVTGWDGGPDNDLPRVRAELERRLSVPNPPTGGQSAQPEQLPPTRRGESNYGG